MAEVCPRCDLGLGKLTVTAFSPGKQYCISCGQEPRAAQQPQAPTNKPQRDSYSYSRKAHDVCACGKPKQVDSQRCFACYQAERRRTA